MEMQKVRLVERAEVPWWKRCEERAVDGVVVGAMDGISRDGMGWRTA